MGLGGTVPGSVFINGVQHAINTPIFNVFDIVKAIRDEVSSTTILESIYEPLLFRHVTCADHLLVCLLVHALHYQVVLLQRIDQLPLPPPSLKSLLRLASEPSDEADMSDARIDIYRGSKGQLHYINNLERVKTAAKASHGVARTRESSITNMR